MNTASAAPSTAAALADEGLVRRHGEALKELASSSGINDLRFAAPGRLVGHVADHCDLLDVAQFDAAASECCTCDASVGQGF